MSVTASVEYRPDFVMVGDDIYIHAKVIVADSGLPSQAAFVGSQNFSTASLDYNRELGLVTTFPALISSLTNTLDSDFATAQAWAS